MEPKLPMPNLGPERSAGFYDQSVERLSVPLPERHERESSAERREASPHQEPMQAPVLPAPVVTSSVVAMPTDNGAAVPVAAVDTPLLANDDDLIEKEWVDKAKQIIASTRDDPYRREIEVGRLQADYLKKRYGKDLGTPRQ